MDFRGQNRLKGTGETKAHLLKLAQVQRRDYLREGQLQQQRHGA